MRVALFARYSSKLQDELSLEAQLDEMLVFVTKNPGWQVTHKFCLPETRSSDIEKADEFRAMMAAAKAKQFDLLLVHKLDRFGRNRDTSVLNKAILRRMGIQVRSVCENLGDSIMDRAFEGMIEVMAEWYSGNLGQETRKGQRAITRRGFFSGGKVPYGYQAQVIWDGNQQRTRLTPCPQTGPVMQEVFRLFAEGAPTRVVLDKIKTMTGSTWSSPSLYTRIKNPLYYGERRYGQTSMPAGRPRTAGEEVTVGSVEPLVTKEIWEAANRARKSRRAPASKAKEHYLLSGLARCSRCGAAVVGNRVGGGYARYHCSERRGGRCSHASVDSEFLERLVLEQVGSYLRSVTPEKLCEAYEATLTPIRSLAEQREVLLRKKLAECQRKIARLLAAVEEGAPYSAIQGRLAELQREEGELVEWLATVHVEVSQIHSTNVGIVREWLAEAAARLEEADPQKLQLLLSHVVRLELDLKNKEGQLTIQLPLEAPASVFAYGRTFGRSALTKPLTYATIKLCLHRVPRLPFASAVPSR